MTLPSRILFVAPSAYPLGGVQTWLDYLLPGLDALGWESTLGLTAGEFHDVDRYVKAHPGHRYISIRNPTGSREGRIRALEESIRAVAPDMVVSANIPDCFAAVERLRVQGQKAPRVVMSNHSVAADYLMDAKWWRHVLDAMVGTNRLTLRLATDYSGMEAARVHYAPYGVEMPDTLARDVRQDAGPLRIAYSGRMDEHQKRTQDIPGILAQLDRLGVDYLLRLAGAGLLEAALTQQLATHSRNGRVEFLGVLAADELNRQLYDWSDVLLVTSFWETGPIVIWEAMARGVAVVSSRYIGSGLEGSLRHGDNCLLFPIGDVAAAAAELQRVADAALRDALVMRGRALVRERYSRAQSVADWHACLRRILEQNSPARPLAATPFEPSGRLDRWIGNGPGETVRRLLARAHRHNDPGGEWPHSNHGLAVPDEEAFWAMALAMDQS